MRATWLWSALVFAACGAGQGHDNPSATGIAGFTVYPGANEFCDGRVYSRDGSHITWNAFSTGDSVAKLAAYYDTKLGDAEKTATADEVTYRYSEAGKVKRVLSLEPRAGGGPWEECKVPRGAKTVIMQSTM